MVFGLWLGHLGQSEEAGFALDWVLSKLGNSATIRPKSSSHSVGKRGTLGNLWVVSDFELGPDLKYPFFVSFYQSQSNFV